MYLILPKIAKIKQKVRPHACRVSMLATHLDIDLLLYSGPGRRIIFFLGIVLKILSQFYGNQRIRYNTTQFKYHIHNNSLYTPIYEDCY